jgi:hypothetical protein
VTLPRRALHLGAEAIREVAVLGTVFVPVDAANDGRLTFRRLFGSVVAGSVVFTLGVWLDVKR